MPNLIPFFEAKSKVNELKALLLRAPQDVAWLEVCVHVAFVVQESQGLEDIAGAVLDHPHGAALVAGVQQQLGHADVQQLQEETARRAIRRVVVGEHTVQRHYGETRMTGIGSEQLRGHRATPLYSTTRKSCGNSVLPRVMFGEMEAQASEGSSKGKTAMSLLQAWEGRPVSLHPTRLCSRDRAG